MQDELRNYMTEVTKNPVAVAFSGGADSALVLKAAVTEAKKGGTPVFAICIQTTLHPMREADEAEKLAGKIGAEFHLLKVDEFKEAKIDNNPKDRCYRCKHYMFTKVKEFAKSLGAETVMDGTNADDLLVYRPGIKALTELGIKSPLAECHITKAMVRELLAQEGIEVANKPSAPCLATRFPYDTPLTEEKIRQVEKAEDYLKTLCVGNIRVRVHEDVARIEVDERQQGIVLVHGLEIVEFFRQLGYTYVTLDLAGFKSGSMDEKILKSGAIV